MSSKNQNDDRFFKYNGSTEKLVPNTQSAFESSVNKEMNTMRASGSPNIGSQFKNMAVTSTNISIICNDMKIGFVQSFSPQETRTITPIQELGTEGVVQMVAANTNGGSISLSRFAIYNSRLFEALGLTHDEAKKEENLFKTLKDQRVPFEIRVETNNGDNNNKYVETYIDCWLTSYSKTIASQTITINETCGISYSDIIVNKIGKN